MRTKPRYWIGVDGEGIGRDPHRYVYLASGDTLGRKRSIENTRGLSTIECLDFFLSHPTDGRLCGYYLGYDWTMILKDLPDKSIYHLLRPELRQLPKEEGGGFSVVEFKGYKLHYLSTMMRVSKKGKSVTVWDIGRFFQAPFVDSLRKWNINAPIDAIEQKKGERSGFSRLTKDIREYCKSECLALSELATALETAHSDIGLKPKSWHGPGSTASVALDAMGIKDKRGDNIPEEVNHAASCAFFGGRFEQSTIGGVDKVYGYDIVSAYPYQSFNLPCLEHGRWRRTKSVKRMLSARHACVRYHVSDIGVDRPWGPLPCRLSNGNIVYPRGGFNGWAWREEFKLAEQHWPGVTFKEAWILETDCDCRPFARVLEWFRERVKLGKSAKGLTLKLLLNSIYGKTAQTVGHPKYASRIWAGMITSGTRAHLLTLMLTHKDMRNVKALATDGLYSTEELDDLPMPLAPDLLGSWERKPHGTMVFVRPGIYWSDSDDTIRARGVGRRNLDVQRERVREAIRNGVERADLGTSVAFGGARMCVYNPRELRRSRHYGQWHEIPARINLTPLPKRNPDWSLRMLDGVESVAYDTEATGDDGKLLRLIADLFWATKG